MKSNIDYVVHSALRTNETINALYYPFDGWYENLCFDDHADYYLFEKSSIYEWSVGKFPINFHVLPADTKKIPNRIDLDLVITNHRTEQLEKVKRIADNFHLPIVLIEHNLPISRSSVGIRKYINARIPQPVHHIVTHQLIKDEWHLENVDVIPYGFNTADNRQNKDVIVVGDYNPEDFTLLENMMNSHHTVTAFGNNHGITKPYVSMDYFLNNLQEHKICILATNDSKPPILQLLAMANGCVTITNRNRWTEQVIEHENTGLFFDNSNSVKKVVQSILDHPEELDRIRGNAYKFIETNHSYEKHSNLMNSYLRSILGEVYIR